MTPNSDGPDVSHHQGAIDWATVKAAGYRLASTKATEGRTFTSPTFDTNWTQMRANGIEYRGCYHWIRSDSAPIDQVRNLRRALLRHGDLRAGEFVQLDWETTPGIRPVTVSEVEEWIRIAEGYWPGRIIVYASDWVPGFSEWRHRHQAYPLWYANYSTGPKPTGGWAECARWGADVWQWTSSATVPGISDPTVDMNHVFAWGTLARISATTKEQDMPREYIATPPPERLGKPWFMCAPGVVRYATNGDDGYPAVPLNVEQYDLLYRNVFGPHNG